MKLPELALTRQSGRMTKTTHSAMATIAFISLMGWQTASEARIFKCVASDGSISYSQSECPYNEKTAKVMSSSGRKQSNINCAVADNFLRELSENMRSGTPSGEVISSYGGFGALSSGTVSMINYVYTFAGNLTTTADRVHELAMQNCRSGTFGVPTCQNLPLEFTEKNNSCAANSNNPPPATAAHRSGSTRATSGRDNNRNSSRNNSTGSSSNSSSSSSRSTAALERERRRAERQAQRQAALDEDE